MVSYVHLTSNNSKPDKPTYSKKTSLREENDNELGTNHDDDPDEVGEVYDGEEDDEEDQGYDNQEVGYDDDQIMMTRYYIFLQFLYFDILYC